MPFPPYDQREVRLSLLAALNRFVETPFADDRADRRPNVPLLALAEPAALQAFLDLMTGVVDTLRASPPETPETPEQA
jgi:hypothetical protein